MTMSEKENEPMIPKNVDFRADQMRYFKQYKQDGGNPAQLIRLGVDYMIEKNESEKRKVENYNRSNNEI